MEEKNGSFGKIKDTDVITKTVKTNNSGTVDMVVEADSIPSFLQVIFTPEVLKPQERGTIEIVLDPSKTGHYGHFRSDLRFAVNSTVIKLPFQINAYIEPDFSNLSEEELASAPKILLENKRINIGKLERFAEKEVVVTFQNTGKRDLTILDIALARSVELKKFTKLVKPGTEGSVILIVKEKSNTQKFSRTIKILTNDPTAFETPVLLQGVLTVTPEEVVPALTARKLHGMMQEFQDLREAAFAQEKVEFRDIVVFDVRSKKLFNKSHIEGALNIQINTTEFKETIENLEKNWVYCFYSDNETDSAKAAKHLMKAGFKETYYLKSGIKDWQKNKLPMSDSYRK